MRAGALCIEGSCWESGGIWRSREVNGEDGFGLSCIRMVVSVVRVGELLMLSTIARCNDNGCQCGGVTQWTVVWATLGTARVLTRGRIPAGERSELALEFQMRQRPKGAGERDQKYEADVAKWLPIHPTA